MLITFQYVATRHGGRILHEKVEEQYCNDAEHHGENVEAYVSVLGQAKCSRTAGYNFIDRVYKSVDYFNINNFVKHFTQNMEGTNNDGIV